MDLREMARKYLSLRDTASGMKDHAEKAIGAGVTLAETGAAAFSAGYLNGYSPAPGKDHHELAKNVPTDLAVGAGLHLLAFLGGAGDYSRDAHALGNGLVASWAARSGARMGSERRLTAPQQATKGLFGPSRDWQSRYGSPSYAPEYQGVG